MPQLLENSKFPGFCAGQQVYGIKSVLKYKVSIKINYMFQWFLVESFLTTVVTYLQYIYLYLSVSFLIWQKNMVDWPNLSTDPSQQQPQSKVLSILWLGFKMCVFWLFWHVKGNFLHNFDEPGKKAGIFEFSSNWAIRLSSWLNKWGVLYLLR